MTNAAGRRHRTARRLGAVLAGVALAAVLGASPADAHSRRGHAGGAFVHGRHHVVHGRFAVPHRIPVHRVHVYRPYYHGRVFFKPHRHFHAVYHFPVYTAYGIAYEPYYYCDGALFLPPYYGGYVSYSSPRFGVFVGF